MWNRTWKTGVKNVRSGNEKTQRIRDDKVQSAVSSVEL